MFYLLSGLLGDSYIIFNVFRYITFRSIMSAITSFMLCIFLGPYVIERLKQFGVRHDSKKPFTEAIHAWSETKSQIPTMGGLLIIVSIITALLLWGNLQNRFILWLIAIVLWFGFVGFIDDWIKIRRQYSIGLRSRTKFAGQVILGTVLGWYLFVRPHGPIGLYMPFFKSIFIPLGILYIPFVVAVLVGTSNAMNLTDGMDGLAIGCLIMAAGAFTIITYATGHAVFSKYLNIPFVAEAGELAVACAALVGAGAGFLWFNAYPANIFMGDTGSLSLGGCLGAIAIFVKQELVLLIVGGVFVWEALSVILQVTSFRLRGKRIFKCSPYHIHLQMCGWPESKITIRLWIVAFVLALIGLSTLKLR